MIQEKQKGIYGKILVIALPILAQQATQSLQFLLDQMMLGKYDPTGELLSVTGNAIPVVMTFFFFFFSLGIGITSLIAQHIGAKRFEQAERVAESSFLFTTIFTLLSFGVFMIFTRQIFRFMGVDASLLDQAMVYGRIISFGLILFGLEITASSTLQAAGVTVIIMFISITKNVLNLIFNYLLIFGVGPFPELGLVGAGIATVISGSLSSIIYFLFFLYSKHVPFKMTIPGILHSKWKIYRNVLRMGLPTGFESILWKISQLVVIILINSIDKFAMGVYSVIGSVQFMILSLYMGFARAAVTLTGQAWGAKEYRTGIKRGFQCLWPALGVCLGGAVILLLFPEFILDRFADNPDFIARGVPLMRIMAFSLFGQAVNIVMGHSIRASGDPRWMTFSQFLGMIFVIGVGSVNILVFDMGLKGLFIAVMADEWIRGFVNMFYLINKKNHPERAFLTINPIVSNK